MCSSLGLITSRKNDTGSQLVVFILINRLISSCPPQFAFSNFRSGKINPRSLKPAFRTKLAVPCPRKQCSGLASATSSAILTRYVVDLTQVLEGLCVIFLLPVSNDKVGNAGHTNQFPYTSPP